MNRDQALAKIQPDEARELVDRWWLPTMPTADFWVLHPRVGEYAIVVDTTLAGGDDVWSLYYLFSIGPKWMVSADVQNSDPTTVMEKLAVRIQP